jgi:hypothetical protein
LGGGLIILKASCEACRKAIHIFETICLDEHLKHFRVHFKYPSRRPKSRPAKLPLTITKGRSERIEMVDVSDHPVTLVLPEYEYPPGILVNRTADPVKFRPLFFQKQINSDAIILSKFAADSFAVGVQLDNHSFLRLLAKIAHGQMYASFDMSNVRPLLLDIILKGDTSTAGFLIGRGQPLGDFDPDGGSGNLAMMHSFPTSSGTHVIALRLRLFSNVQGAPTYLIVAGESQCEPTFLRNNWTRHFLPGE